MKKLLLAIVLLMGTITVITTQAQPVRVSGRVGYHYYPSANVYYSPATHRYWYPRNGVWVNVGALPRGYVIANRPHYEVYPTGHREIWVDNSIHARRWGRPVVVERPRPRPGVSVHVGARF